MKKLIVHIGYPKTATSTLQINVLRELMLMGEINLFNHISNDNLEYGNIDFRNLYEYILGFKNQVDTNELKQISKIKNLTSIISSESISHVSIDSPRAANKSSTHDNLNRIHEVFSPIFDQIEILMSIRAQKELIPSYYAQEYYNIVLENQNLNDIGEWIEFNFETKRTNILFDYKLMYDTSESLFGKKHTHVLIYEDLINEKSEYFNKLSEVLEIDSNLLISLFERFFHNKTTKSDIGNLVADPETVYFKMATMARKYSMPKFVKSYVKGILPKYILNKKVNSNVNIRKLTSKELNKIHSIFEDSNWELINTLNLDANRMKLYGYL